MILDWRHPLLCCGSLGNITAQALATEVIRDVLGHDVGVLVSGYHRQVWPLCVPPDRIYDKRPDGAEIRVCHPDLRLHPESPFHWVYTSVMDAGFEVPAGYRLSPRIIWPHAPDSCIALLYPREYDNRNRYFTLDYWIALALRLIDRGWGIAAILDNEPSHRDGQTSVVWCRQFRDYVPCQYVFPPTVAGLAEAVSASQVAIGRGNGPAWLMLKAGIRQIIVDDPYDHRPEQTARATMSELVKPLTIVQGTDLRWVERLL